MERAPLVSVLCLTYNHEEYLRGTLDGFLAQETDFPIEILVNDDASTDGTAGILREYAAKRPDLIRPFYQETNLYSQGLDLCIEVLYPEARGKYIALCEGDDYWTDPTKLQRQVDFMEAHPEYSACVHNTMLHYCATDQKDRPLLRHKGDRDVRIEDVAKGVSYSFHTSSILARRDILTAPSPFFHVGLENGFGDHPDALWLIFHGPIRYLDRCMSVYRINSGKNAWSTGVDGEYEKLRSYVDGERKLLVACLEYAPEGFRPAIRQEILEREFELLYIEGRDREQRRPPYDEILKGKPLTYRVKNAVKCAFPAGKRLYRRLRGYVDRGN